HGSDYWGMLYSCYSLGAVYYLFTAYTERAFLQPERLFKQPLREYLFLQILVSILQSIKNVNLERLANGIPLPIKFESRRKRIQRFISLPTLTIEKIWFPIITEWLSIYFTNEKIIYVAIDRTN
ncbi:hypothetical protein VB620_19915, partial [Nodularia harveyana UHCC-0300]|nr:hypothetical protein [Nodularia harveyana UHCC-0300]